MKLIFNLISAKVYSCGGGYAPDASLGQKCLTYETYLTFQLSGGSVGWYRGFKWSSAPDTIEIGGYVFSMSIILLPDLT